jgi:calmodulin
MSLPAHNLTNEELAEFREIFNLVDRDGGGTITKEELGELMDTLGIDATPEEIDLMINEIDQDSNGEIDFEEFVAVMSRKVNATYTSDQVKNAFKIFETGAPSGFIKVDTLIKSLTTYGTEKLTEDQAQELVSQLEPDANGMINYSEYIDMMMHE